MSFAVFAGIFAGFAFAFIVVSLSVHIYMFKNDVRWTESFNEYLM